MCGEQLKVLLPEQRQQIVGGFGLSIRAVQHLHEPHDLGLLDAGAQRDRANAVLEQRPGNALVLLVVTVDDAPFPAQLGLGHVQDEILGDFPDLAAGDSHVLDRPLVHGVVWEVQLDRPERLAHEREHLFDLRQRQGEFGSRRVAHVRCPVSSATRATSLSPGHSG
jgi:hypothetical protein